MKNNNLIINISWTISILSLLVAFMHSCSKDEIPIYQGKWVLEDATPQLDASYFGSYIYIKADKSFELYDSSQELLIIGNPQYFSLDGVHLSLTDPGNNKEYRFIILSRKQDILVLRTSIFGSETKLTMRKVST